MGNQIEHAKNNKKELIPVLQEFKEFIEGNSRIYMYFVNMFQEVPMKHPYVSFERVGSGEVSLTFATAD